MLVSDENRLSAEYREVVRELAQMWKNYTAALQHKKDSKPKLDIRARNVLDIVSTPSAFFRFGMARFIRVMDKVDDEIEKVYGKTDGYRDFRTQDSDEETIEVEIARIRFFIDVWGLRPLYRERDREQFFADGEEDITSQEEFRILMEQVHRTLTEEHSMELEGVEQYREAIDRLIAFMPYHESVESNAFLTDLFPLETAGRDVMVLWDIAQDVSSSLIKLLNQLGLDNIQVVSFKDMLGVSYRAWRSQVGEMLERIYDELVYDMLSRGIDHKDRFPDLYSNRLWYLKF